MVSQIYSLIAERAIYPSKKMTNKEIKFTTTLRHHYKVRQQPKMTHAIVVLDVIENTFLSFLLPLNVLVFRSRCGNLYLTDSPHMQISKHACILTLKGVGNIDKVKHVSVPCQLHWCL